MLTLNIFRDLFVWLYEVHFDRTHQNASVMWPGPITYHNYLLVLVIALSTLTDVLYLNYFKICFP